MNKTRALKASLACGLLWASTIGFLAVAATAGKAPDSTALEAVVRGLIGDAACEMHDQCRTLAFGAKACGGPQSYLPWSTLRTDEAALKEAAENYAARRRTEVSDSGRASNCALVVDPGAYCAATIATASGIPPSPLRTCRLRSARAAR